jgi:rhodanese-related sulfurtransferase
MKLRSLVVFALSLVLLFSVVSGAAAQEPTGDLAVVQAAIDTYLSSGKAPVLSADALWENLNDGDPDNDPFILSVRSPEHYALGHIPGAVNIPWKELANPENLAKLPTDQPIVTYCYTGHTGQIASTVLNALGYDATNLKFGMMGWTEDDEVLATKRFGPDTDQRDYRVDQEPNEATESYAYPELSTGVEGDFEIVRAAAEQWLTSPAAAPIISADALWENLGDGDPDNDPFILSVRKPESYELGHVPGAVNIPWNQVAKTENLAKLPADQEIVAYCYTGHTGQVATTALGMMGYPVSNIKYGMMGWTEDDEVLASARFGPDVQRDYRIESAADMEIEEPAEEQVVEAPVAELPDTGAPASPLWLVGLVAGLGSLVAGLALRRRVVQ